MDLDAARRAVEELLRALGHEPTGPLEGTAERVARTWGDELLGGEDLDAGAILREGASDAAPPARGQLVVLRGLSAVVMCPHHLLPAHGQADVAYLPDRRVAGLGHIARALAACTRRLTLQEEAGAQLAAALVEQLGARGAACRLTLTHTCLLARGERETTASLETLALAGSFSEAGTDRDVLLAAFGPGEVGG